MQLMMSFPLFIKEEKLFIEVLPVFSAYYDIFK